jgi:hypothetical protein
MSETSLDPNCIIDEDRYRVALTAERSVAALDRARATLVSDLQQLSSYFRQDRYSRRADWKRPESKLETVLYAIPKYADYLAYAIVHQESGMSPESIRNDMAGIMGLVEYLRDVERYEALGCGYRASLGPRGEEMLEWVREEFAEEAEAAD